MMLLMLYWCVTDMLLLRAGHDIILQTLVSLVGFCCFAWSAWNGHVTIRHLKNQLEIYEKNMNYKEKARWIMPKWAAIIVKIIACVWATAMTLIILCWCVIVVLYGADAYVWIALVSLVGFGCFALSAWINYSTTRDLKSQVKIYEENGKER
jgi:hypothetical protein